MFRPLSHYLFKIRLGNIEPLPQLPVNSPIAQCP